MKDPNCAYCMQGELIAKFGYPVCKMDTGYLYVFKEQSHPGRMILAHDKHISEMIELTDEERNAFFADLAKAAKAIHKVYQPKKVNYGAYGDTGCHLHFHLVPKYEGEYEYGGVFEMNPGRVVITEEECEVIAEKIRQALAEL
ncbi:MAG: HIT family protein [Lachnospiraceae bacterium]|nr:HIT family protein [Lachnospiraceae bacterium]